MSKDSTFALPSKKRKEFLGRAVQKYKGSLHLAENYLVGRGIPVEVAQAWSLGVVEEPLAGHEDFVTRLAIPYLTPSGPVDMKFRCITQHDCSSIEGHVKYLNESGSQARVFGVWNLRRDTDVLYLCEGEMDTIAAWSLGGLPAVGVSGASKWRSHWQYIFESYSEVVLLRHGDSAGRKMADNYSSHLPNLRVVGMPEGHDVNSFIQEHGPEALKERVAQ